MWCSVGGRRIEVSLDKTLNGYNSTLINILDIPQREQAVLVCFFRGFLVKQLIENNFSINPLLPDFNTFLLKTLKEFGIKPSLENIILIHSLAIEYYIRGQMFSKSHNSKNKQIAGIDSDLFVEACINHTKKETIQPEFLNILKTNNILIRPRSDTSLDTIFQIKTSYPVVETTFQYSLSLIGEIFSQAIFSSIKSTREYLNKTIDERILLNWLKENQVDCYTKSNRINLVSRNQTTSEWWNTLFIND